MIFSVRKTPLSEVLDSGERIQRILGKGDKVVSNQVNELRWHLGAALKAINKNDSEAVLLHSALFLHLFVHAHPFNNINNSIAMNIINDLLEKAKIGVLPHLYFDYIALVSKPLDFAEFFKAAIPHHVINEDYPDERKLTASLMSYVRS